MARLCKEMGVNDAFLAKLKLNKIITVSDYLQEDTEKLSSLCDVPFKEVREVRQKLITNFSALPVNGTLSYQHLISHSALLQTGIEKLDQLLGGGLLTGTVMELCGLSGDGKTQLCLTIAANLTVSLNQVVHYIDTKQDFSAQRVFQIMKSRSNSEEVCKAALERIKVIRIKSIYDLIRHLHSVRKSFVEEDCSMLRVVIVDAMPVLYFPFMGRDHNKGFGLLNHVMATMKSMATEFHLLFIVVNLATSFVEAESSTADGEEEEESKDQIVTNVRPMLGKYWLHAPHTRLVVSKVNNESSQQLITILKSTTLPLGKSCVVSVSQRGVVGEMPQLQG